MKKIVNILNRLLTILLIAVLVFGGYVFVKVLRAGKERVPSVFGYSFMQVATGSMEPTIQTGSLIIVRETGAENIQVGDVITFYSSDPLIAGKPNTHRVVAVRQENGQPVFTTRGDAAQQDDPYPVYPAQLIGVFCRSFSVGNLVQILHSPYFFFFVLVVPLIAVIFAEVVRVKKTAEEKREIALEKEKADDGKAS
ncbi:MAG: signal peptidase I [Clostridia bacterium]|nr:signal peptidase I [Clostridia bacterium]